jgi:hypothetical protein
MSEDFDYCVVLVLNARKYRRIALSCHCAGLRPDTHYFGQMAEDCEETIANIADRIIRENRR